MKQLRTIFAAMFSAMALQAADLPQFIVPGHEAESKALHELHALHHDAAFTDCTLWDAWLPMATLWAQNGSSEWRTLFDRTSLKGWKNNARGPHSKASGHTTAGNWRVGNGAIIDSQDTPGNSGMFITKESFGDFEVVLETNNDFGPDSGLFMRCTEDGKAYQCLIDYHEGGTIGGILGEGIWKRRGLRNHTFGTSLDLITLNENEAHPCPVLPESWRNFWRVGEWNEVRARITGDPPTITTWVNGLQIMQHTETTSVHPAGGHIGLQVHGGAKFAGTVRYRNIRVRSF